jgi:hypothetical protein
MTDKAKGAANVEKVYRMAVGDVYPMYVRKAERKGRTKEEVDAIITWLTGYSTAEVQAHMLNGMDLETFFLRAPGMNPNAEKITGMICGYRVEEIEDRIIRRVRYLDKLIDELAKGKAMEKILRS